MSLDEAALDLGVLERCFTGAIPAVLATVAADGTPNVTFLSKAHRVDDERIALSNQFMSKTTRNLAVNPRASLLLIDPVNCDEFRMLVAFERTVRQGHVFDRLREEVDTIAALTGMQDVFRLRAADIFRVLSVEVVPHASERPEDAPRAVASMAEMAELVARVARSADLDAVVGGALDAVDELLGYRHVHLMLLDETKERLFTIASRGYDEESVGAEVDVGEGVAGVAAERCAPLRVDNLRQMTKYAIAVRHGFEVQGRVSRGELRATGLDGAKSRLAVPAMARGQLVGVLVADRLETAAFDAADEQVLSVAAAVIAGAIEAARMASDEETSGIAPVLFDTPPAPGTDDDAVCLRFYPPDGSTFVDDAYLIKGVAGRILWSLLNQWSANGRVDFTNRELRLDPSLELPDFKDNLESRLVLLKRRLDEHRAPFRIERTGRGRFRLQVEGGVRMELADP